jgi:hypothetical protein
MKCSTIGRTIVTASILFGSTSGVRAECIRVWKDAADAERRSTMVFSGTVVALKGDPDGLFATFDVQRVYKGHVAHRLVLPLHTDLDTFRLVEGMTYLIFADQLHGDARDLRGPTETEPVFFISLCSPSRQLTSVNERIQELGKPRPPSK